MLKGLKKSHFQICRGECWEECREKGAAGATAGSSAGRPLSLQSRETAMRFFPALFPALSPALSLALFGDLGFVSPVAGGCDSDSSTFDRRMIGSAKTDPVRSK